MARCLAGFGHCSDVETKPVFLKFRSRIRIFSSAAPVCVDIRKTTLDNLIIIVMKKMLKELISRPDPNPGHT